MSRPPLASVASGAERELVSGASAPLVASATGLPPAGLLPTAGQPTGLQAPPVAASATVEGNRAARAKEAEPSWSQLAARAQSWTAAVRADLNYGAGVVVDRSGLVLTNLHVIANVHNITVTPFGGEPSPAQLLDSDTELDLALLSVSVPKPLTEAAELGSAAPLGVGDEVLAVGSPRKMYFSVSRGMVSFPNRLLEGVEYIQTDLPINEGNSGGPLVDREGHVVGIVSFILRESQGLSFALPIERAVRRFAAHLTPSPALAAIMNGAETANGAAVVKQSPVSRGPASRGPASRGPASRSPVSQEPGTARQLRSRELPSGEPPARRAH